VVRVNLHPHRPGEEAREGFAVGSLTEARVSIAVSLRLRQLVSEGAVALCELLKKTILQQRVLREPEVDVALSVAFRVRVGRTKLGSLVVRRLKELQQPVSD
jgi:hypothetical protein